MSSKNCHCDCKRLKLKNHNIIPIVLQILRSEECFENYSFYLTYKLDLKKQINILN